MWSKFLAMLGESIFGTDIYILFCVGITCIALFFVGHYADAIACTIEKSNMKRKWKRTRNLGSLYQNHKNLTVAYSVFLTCVSLFPLLGMLGTVASLVTLDFSTGNMAEVRNNFFSALTSTAWGIIWSIIFKVVNAFISCSVENQLEFSKKSSEECDDSMYSMMNR